MNQDILKEFEDEIVEQKRVIKDAKIRKKELKGMRNEINEAQNIGEYSTFITTEYNLRNDDEAETMNSIQNVPQYEMEDEVHKAFDYHEVPITEEQPVTTPIDSEDETAITISKRVVDETEQNNQYIDNEDQDHTDIELSSVIEEETYLYNSAKFDTGVDTDREIIVNAKNIKKNYGKAKILHGINLKIYKGDRVAILGPNGAGKTTLTEIIAKIKEPTRGVIEYSFGKTKKEISSKIGIQFQETSYPSYFRVIDIIKFFNEATRMFLSKEQINELLDQFQLAGLEKRHANSLSGGQKQRLNVLLAILNNPELILLDELSTGLDVQSRDNIKKFMHEFLETSNATMLLVSHNVDEIEYLANRLVIIYDGIIFDDVSIDKIRERYGSVQEYIDHLFSFAFARYEERKEQVIKEKEQILNDLENQEDSVEETFDTAEENINDEDIQDEIFGEENLSDDQLEEETIDEDDSEKREG